MATKMTNAAIETMTSTLGTTPRLHPVTGALNAFVKRGFDLALASAALVMLAPLLIGLAVLLKREGGPVVFTQRRVGRAGARFDCLKFRTMLLVQLLRTVNTTRCCRCLAILSPPCLYSRMRNADFHTIDFHTWRRQCLMQIIRARTIRQRLL